MTTPSLNHPDEEICSWVEQGQLRLVAVALTELTTESPRRSPEHSVAALRGKLAPLLEQSETKWDTWWKKVLPWLKDSEHFQFNKTGNTVTYRLADRIAAGNIPVKRVVGKPKTAGTGDSTGSSSSSPARKSATKSSAGRDLPEWVRWLWSADDAPLPGTTPPDGLPVLLETCPEEIIERVMARLMSGVEEALAAPRLTPKAKDQWLELVTKAHRRRQEVPGQESTGATARRTPKILAQLTEALHQQTRIQPLLAQIGPLLNTNQHWRQEFARGVWDTFQSNRSAAGTLLERLAANLDDKQQIALWGDVLTAAFAGHPYPNLVSDLSWVLYPLKADLHPAAIQRLVLQASLWEDSQAVVSDFVAGSRYFEPAKLNKLALTTAMLLPRGESDPSEKVAKVALSYFEALDKPRIKDLDVLVEIMLGTAHGLVSKVRGEARDKETEQSRVHQAELAKAANENTALERQVRTLRDEIAANREGSRLEIRRDMLEAMAATLKALHQQQVEPTTLLLDAEAGLKLAMQAGEAQFYGEASQRVEYDPELHESPEILARGETVIIVHPGAFIPGTKTGNYILLKAQVKRRPEGNR